MKKVKGVFYGLSLLAGSALAIALSTPAPVNAQQAPVCLNVIDILTTQPTNARTIIYRMRNGDVWRNDLAYPCPDLVNFSAGGYTQVAPIGGWICGNSQMIRTQTGSMCRLGRFTRVN